MAIKRAIRWANQATNSEAGLAYLYSEWARERELVCIQRLAWEINKATSGGNTRVRVYIDRAGVRWPIDEQAGPTASALYTLVDPFWLVPGERICLEIDEAQASTLAKMWAMGYFTDFPEGFE